MKNPDDPSLWVTAAPASDDLDNHLIVLDCRAETPSRHEYVLGSSFLWNCEAVPRADNLQPADHEGEALGQSVAPLTLAIDLAALFQIP
jgi:hypothetical protein